MILTGRLDVDRVAQELAGSHPRNVVLAMVSRYVDILVRSKHLPHASCVARTREGGWASGAVLL